MTYKINKFKKFQVTDNPSDQTISTTFTEITGSKCLINSPVPNPTLVYKFQFYTRDSGSKQNFLNVKLQKSNDNFSSNIVDVEHCNFNISGDTENSSDTYEQTVSTFFILQNFDSDYLRIVARSYSSSYESVLHRSNEYDGASATTIYYNPTLIILEV